MTNNRVDVVVSCGRLRGIVEENVYNDSYTAFRGIPYAKPPIGKLRFQEPVPPEPWSDLRNAVEFGNIALQMDLLTKEVIGDEDCLYLNVYTTNIQPKQNRVVMVWIHGGGFESGSGNDDMYGPEYILKKEVVLVTINYRLGALGFLNLEHKIAAGNQGLKDCLMALQWVQENIANFGGDPGNVTIFGESAGAAIVHYLALCPSAQGLFHKAISQSGTTANPWTFTDKPTEAAFLLAEKLGMQTSEPEIAGTFLQTIDAKKIIEVTQENFRTDINKMKLLLAFTPSMDCDSPNPLFLEYPSFSNEVKVPFLLGFNSCEGSLFTRVLTEKLFQLLNSNFEAAMQPRASIILETQSIKIDKLRRLYFSNKPITENVITDHANFIGDMYFYHGIYQVADAQIRQNHRPTYMYQFSYESDFSLARKRFNIKIPGAAHAEELSYLFYPHIAKNVGMAMPKSDSDDFKIITAMTQMWTNFAKMGDPTPVITDEIPIKWTPLEGGNAYQYLEIDRKLQMKTIPKDNIRCNWENMKHEM